MDRAREQDLSRNIPRRVNASTGRGVERTMNTLRRSPSRWRVITSSAACAVALLAGILPASAQSSSGSSSDADELDVLTATREEVHQALAEMEERYAEQRAEVERAEDAVAVADLAVERANSRVALADHEVELARETVAAYAVEAYIRPPAQDSLRVLSITRADDASYVSSVIQILTEERHQVVGILVGKREAADRERAAADEASKRARTAASDAQVKLVELDRMRAQQQSLAATLDERLDSALAEVAALAAIDQQMADELAAQELALRQAGPATPPQAQLASTDPGGGRAEPPQSNGSAPTRPPTTRPQGPTPTRPPTTRPPTSPPPGVVTWSDVTRVGGIWVHKSVATNVRNLLNAATAAGLNLAGGGYRDPQGQIDTRRNNCGPTHYDIYEKPASHCHPPTARPGTSMHERGLAIDFTSSGSLITSRSNPAFVWLKGNAARFGFYNLPSEPWHWSTTGG